MNRVVISFLALLLAFGCVNAQNANADTGSIKKFTFRYMVSQESISSVDRTLLAEHPFGDLIARKLYLLQDAYTYIEPPTPTSPGEKTIVLKPTIYNAILKVNRTLKKQVKKGIVEKNTATKDLNNCLDVALSIAADETDEFETELKKAKSADLIILTFKSVELR